MTIAFGGALESRLLIISGYFLDKAVDVRFAGHLPRNTRLVFTLTMTTLPDM